MTENFGLCLQYKVTLAEPQTLDNATTLKVPSDATGKHLHSCGCCTLTQVMWSDPSLLQKMEEPTVISKQPEMLLLHFGIFLTILLNQ